MLYFHLCPFGAVEHRFSCLSSVDNSLLYSPIGNTFLNNRTVQLVAWGLHATCEGLSPSSQATAQISLPPSHWLQQQLEFLGSPCLPQLLLHAYPEGEVRRSSGSGGWGCGHMGSRCDGGATHVSIQCSSVCPLGMHSRGPIAHPIVVPHVIPAGVACKTYSTQ